MAASIVNLLAQVFLLPLLSQAVLPRRAFGVWRQAEVPPNRPSALNCTWKTFDQRIDHFGTAKGTFKQRYCVYDKYHADAKAAGFNASADSPGPMFFYCGNESPLEEYVNNTGFMWELGKELHALLVFVEHRYEPLSHPSLDGPDSPERCFAYCTTAQALVDYAAVIQYLNPGGRMPVTVFGGSYGGMLAGWIRMKYPGVVNGAIAASAPIWQFATTVEKSTLDSPAIQLSRGTTAAGGASDRCFRNLQAAWPLLEQVGNSSIGLTLLSQRLNTCKELTGPKDLTSWAQACYFLLAEGNYPYPSTYIPSAVGPGYHPLPAWPMRVACSHLDRDFGIKIEGAPETVSYSLTLGKIHVDIDWAEAVGNGASLSESDIRDSGVLDLAQAIASASGVWYNVTQDQKCWDIPAAESQQHSSRDRKNISSGDAATSTIKASDCPACPPCDDCPPCGVSRCETDAKQCSHRQTLPKTFSWEGISVNDDLSQIAAHGLGKDIFWPPSKGQPDGIHQILPRNYTVEMVVGPHKEEPGYNSEYDAEGLYGAPTVSDPWSNWLTAYYGGRNVSHHTNIIWSNGLLDPWSGMGVYPPGGGPNGPMIQKVSEDGSSFALLLDLGAHHLDLMFSDPRDPPCAIKARAIETQSIRTWSQSHYDMEPKNIQEVSFI
eukprot:TRINITY_DN26106_c0_g1_i1.p1 TRINITY_DN26106_c0_g1~~TRINITY_DN26106_c0_g1_i1.p1  ORF type:complete len:660 (+),score=60.60 TRINITY_DN26106_c0_g1_i1:58-2037(+)